MFTAFGVFVVAVVLLLSTASQRRGHAARSDRPLCPSCATPHESFARFCRRCGRAIGRG